MSSRANDADEAAFGDNHAIEEFFMSCAQEGSVDFLARAFTHFSDFEGAEEHAWIRADHSVGKCVEEDFCPAKKIAEVEVCTSRECAVK